MIVIVGCGKRKLFGNVAAGLMYTGSLFTSHMQLARLLPARKILILSACYGVVELDQVIEAYDTTLADLSTQQRKAWRAAIASRIELEAEPKELVIVLAGASYLTWAAECERRVTAPLAGMMLGERRSVVKALVDGREHALDLDDEANGDDVVELDELRDELADELRLGGVAPQQLLLGA